MFYWGGYVIVVKYKYTPVVVTVLMLTMEPSLL